ncbi:hypothetical protein GALL_514110 [mine drainage metagenome]|uniref:Uncharacterized protein n=1 Tax=mine drainage metagenome TaxID=410659 RepID=A0A1J5P8F0_9ZZZZ
MRAGIQNAVVPPQQFRAGISTDFAEIIVCIGDGTAQIGHRDDDGLIDCILFLQQFLSGSFGASFCERRIGDVLVDLYRSAVGHGMAADRDDRPIPEFVGGVMCLPGRGIAQAVGDVFRRIQRTTRRGYAAVENFAQRRPGSRLRRRKSVHFGIVAIANQDPEVCIENAQTVRRAFDRRP